MLTIPSTVQALFKTDGVYKNFRVHFPNGEFPDITNDNVVQESVKFTESLCSQSTFKFGLAEASVLEFETVGIGNMYGMTIEAGIEIDCSSLSAAQKTAIASGTWDGTWDSVNEMFYIPYGTFRIESCPRDHRSMAHRQVTAYSNAVLSNGIVFPKRMLWDNIYANIMAIKAAASGDGLATDSTETFTTMVTSNVREIYLYDSSKNRHTVTLWDLDGGTTAMLYGCHIMNNLSSATDRPSFVSVAMPDYNATEYEQLGVAVAKEITDNGYDFTYDVTGAQRFSSNEEALRYCAPWLFAPCIIYDLTDSSGSWRTMCVQPYKNGELVPIVCSQEYSDSYNVGFHIKNNKYKLKAGLDSGLSNIVGVTAFALAKTTSGENVRINLSGGATLDVELEGYLTSVPTATRYNLNSYSEEIGIKNTGTEKFFYDNTQGAVSSVVIQRNGYNYEIPQENILKLFTGATEITAEFLKSNRLGGFETIKLDNSSPVAVSPGDYAECWWDEYDIDPIGTVIVTYQDDTNGDSEMNTTAITIGSGLSLYDMSDNEVLKNLLNTDFATVTSLINTNFKPYVGTVAFTPTELTMQGWPWIEAGDALEITAEDGTVVDTYALRVEMDGIQHLQAVITAEGGEIIGEVS